MLKWQWLFRILSIAGGVFAAVVVAEVALRAYQASTRQDPIEALTRTLTSKAPPFGGNCDSPALQAHLGDIVDFSPNADLVYELKPNVDTCYFGARLRTSAQRVRGSKKYSIPKSPDTFRVLVLGDSLTLGQGVADDDPFSERLRELLEQRRGKPVEVINAGLDGYNTVQEAAWLEQRGVALEPDCVVLLYCGNDLDPPTFLKRPGTGVERDRLYVGQLLSKVFRPRKDALGDRFGLVHENDVIPEYRHLAGLDAYLRALGKLDRLVDHAKIPLVLFADYDDNRDWHAVEAFIEKAGILRPKFRLPADLKDHLGLHNNHFNREGHREVARRMFEALVACGERCTGSASTSAPPEPSSAVPEPTEPPPRSVVGVVPPGRVSIAVDGYSQGVFASFGVEGKAGRFTLALSARGTPCKGIDGAEYASLAVKLDGATIAFWPLTSDRFVRYASKSFQLSGQPQLIEMSLENDLYEGDACDRNISVEWAELSESSKP